MSEKKQRLPKFSQWKQIFKVFNKTEKRAFFVLLIIFLASFAILSANFYFTKTKVSPAYSGTFREGLVGQPRFINPLYLATEDVDRDVVELLFAGLMKYNSQGELIYDLLEAYQIKEKGKIIDVKLKDNLFWHDQEPITADDIIFTIDLIQDPQTQSSLLIKWLGVTTEKISDKEVRFRLPKEYAGFIENLTIKILPKHIFEEIAPKDLLWKLISQRYLIGSGPFKFKNLEEASNGEAKTLTLERYEKYHLKKPYLKEFVFVFYQNINDLIKASKTGDINGFSLSDPAQLKKASSSFNDYHLAIPRYFALFFNLNEKGIFADKEMRQAIGLAIDKQEILERVFDQNGAVIHSPLLPKFFGFATSSYALNFNQEQAIAILEQKGFNFNEDTGKREKLDYGNADFTFEKNLVPGSKNDDVKKLQECLAQDPSVYPEGTISGYYGAKTKAAVIKFQEKYAADILTPIGLSKGTGDVKPMTRKKLNEICFDRPEQNIELKITITTSNKFPLVEIAEIIKDNLEAIGVNVELEKTSLSNLETDALAQRNFEALLFGEALGAIPDLFPFWHSSQKEYPGLNIASYSSKTADGLLESSRETSELDDIQTNLEKFQDTLLDNLPAVFLTQPDYLYLLSSQVKGFDIEKIIEPSKRFSTIENWYLKTQRSWK